MVSNCPTPQKDTRGLPVSRVTASTHTLSPSPKPTHLVGLEIIVQRKLQFAQVLWLFLLLAFTFSFSQACLCIVIILGELQVGGEFKEEGRTSLHKDSRSCPKAPNRDAEHFRGCLGRSTGLDLRCLRIQGRQ